MAQALWLLQAAPESGTDMTNVIRIVAGVLVLLR